MRILACSVLIIHVAAGAAYAQTFNDLQIQLGVSYSTGQWRDAGQYLVQYRARDRREAFGEHILPWGQLCGVECQLAS